MSLFNNKLSKVPLGMLDTDVQNKFTGYDTSLAQITSKQKFVDAIVDYGCKADGMTDDTTKLQNAINSLNDGDTLHLKGLFLTTSTITVGKNIKIDGQYATIIANHNNVGLSFVPINSSGFFGNRTSTGTTWYSYSLDITLGGIIRLTFNQNTTAIGFQVINCQNGRFDVRYLLNHFIGMELNGDVVNSKTYGFVYNHVYLGRFEDCVTGLLLQSNNNGWVTENNFYDGSFQANAVSNQTQLDTHIKLVDLKGSLGNNNNNKFHGVSLEGFHPTGISIVAGETNTFYNPRFELPSTPTYLNIDSQSQGNIVYGGYGIMSGLQSGKVVDNGYYNRISGAAFETGGIEYYNKVVYEFVKQGSNFTASYPNGITRQSIGGARPIQTITASTGTVNIDFSQADHFHISATADITSITFSNVSSEGVIKTISFSQGSAGNVISGFPSLFLGSSAAVATPTKRAYGRDTYMCMNGLGFANEMYAISHYGS